MNSAADPSHNDTAEQKARSEENKQETEQILKSHRLDKILAPSLFLKILEVYLLFVAVVGGTGVLAFYSHHDTILEIVLIASVVFILIAVFSTLWYLLVSFRKKPATENMASGKQALLVRITRSSMGRSLLRLANNRIVRILSFVPYVWMITYAIIRFPLQPRVSLALIVVYITFFLVASAIEIVRSLESALRKEIAAIWKFADVLKDTILGLSEILRDVNAKATDALVMAGNLRKFIDDTEPGHMEMHKTTTDALRAIQHSTELLATTVMIRPDQVDAQTEEDAGHKGD